MEGKRDTFSFEEESERQVLRLPNYEASDSPSPENERSLDLDYFEPLNVVPQPRSLDPLENHQPDHSVLQNFFTLGQDEGQIQESNRLAGKKRNPVSLKGKKQARSISEEEAKRKLEKNREKSRNCRKRKKMYVASLEHQIEVLKWELEICKKKVAEYEERERSKNIMDFFQRLNEDTKNLQEMSFCNLFEYTQKNLSNMGNVTSRLKRDSEERVTALEILAKAMVEIFIPISHKYCLWVVENDTEVYNKMGGEEIWGKRELEPTYFSKARKNKQFLQNAATLLRKNVEIMMYAQREIQTVVMNIDQWVRSLIGPQLKPSSIRSFTQWIHMVIGKPVLGELDLGEGNLPSFCAQFMDWPLCPRPVLSIPYGIPCEVKEKHEPNKQQLKLSS